jgi:hypothetical protein
VQHDVCRHGEGIDEFTCAFFGVSAHDARHRFCTGLVLRSLPIPQVLSTARRRYG